MNAKTLSFEDFEKLLKLLNRENVTEYEGFGLRLSLMPYGPHGAPMEAPNDEDEYQ